MSLTAAGRAVVTAILFDYRSHYGTRHARGRLLFNPFPLSFKGRLSSANLACNAPCSSAFFPSPRLTLLRTGFVTATIVLFNTAHLHNHHDRSARSISFILIPSTCCPMRFVHAVTSISMIASAAHR